MALPFFKKSDGKMPTRPAVKPAGPARAVEVPTKSPEPALDDDLGDLDFTGIEVVEEVDPLVGAIEAAAIAFANDKDEETESVLKGAISGGEHSPEAERIWLMLFDFYLVAGRKDAFSPLELEFAKRFEKQPPIWRDLTLATPAKAAPAGAHQFKGPLAGSNAAGLAQLEQWICVDPKPKIDLSAVEDFDAAGCESFLAAVQKARKKKRALEISGSSTIADRLKPRIEAGETEPALWRMLLECYQLQGQQDDFENLAVEFAVNFEISPPSWEAIAAPAKPVKVLAASALPGDDAFRLAGEIRGGRMDGLEAYLGDRLHVVIDMSDVKRIDFASGGVLLNLLVPPKQRGAEVTLRHPNRLVAELLNVMGLGDLAKVTFAKR